MPTIEASEGAAVMQQPCTVPNKARLKLPNEVWQQILGHLADIPNRHLSCKKSSIDCDANKFTCHDTEGSEQMSCDIEPHTLAILQDDFAGKAGHRLFRDHTLALRWLLNFSACSRNCRVIAWALIVPRLAKHGIRNRDQNARHVLRLVHDNLEEAAHIDLHYLHFSATDTWQPKLSTMRALTISLDVPKDIPPTMLNMLASHNIELHVQMNDLEVLVDRPPENWFGQYDVGKVESIVALFTSPALRSIRFMETPIYRIWRWRKDMLWWQSLQLLATAGPANLHTIHIEGTYLHNHRPREMNPGTTQVIEQVREINKVRCKLQTLCLLVKQANTREDQTSDFPKVFSLDDIFSLMYDMDLSQLRHLTIQQYLTPYAMRWLSRQVMPKIEELNVHGNRPKTAIAAFRLLLRNKPLKSLSIQCSTPSSFCQRIVHLHGAAIRKLSFPWSDMSGRTSVNMDYALVKAIVASCPRLQFLRIAIARSLDYSSSTMEYATITALSGLTMLTHLQLGLDCTPMGIKNQCRHFQKKADLLACYGRVLVASIVDASLLRQIWDAVFSNHIPGPLLLNPRELQVAPVYCLDDSVTPWSPDRDLLETALWHLGKPKGLSGFGSDPQPSKISENWCNYGVFHSQYAPDVFCGPNATSEGHPVWLAYKRFIFEGCLRYIYDIRPQSIPWLDPEAEAASAHVPVEQSCSDLSSQAKVTFGTQTYAQVVKNC